MVTARYTVTVYAAAPGTPIRNLHDNGSADVAASAPGHMYYGVSDGTESASWGFSPVEHGSINGPGTVSEGDANIYQDPVYARTMEISQGQYEKLKEFGRNPSRFGFDMNYKDIRNNCVDFTWAALNHAGIQRTHGHIGHLTAHGVDGKLSYLPSLAPHDIRTIRDPFPGSELNREETHPQPERKDWWQIPLSAPERVGYLTPSDAFEDLYSATVTNDASRIQRIGEDYLKTHDGQALMEAGAEMNRQQDLAEQVRVQEQQSQSIQQRVPSMAMSI